MTAPPHNIEAEQQLLGAMLLDADQIDAVGHVANADLFYEPSHARLYDAMRRRHRAGELVSPVALKLFAEQDEGLKDLGGPEYLVRLAGAGAARSAVRGYAEFLDDLRGKRAIQTAMQAAEEGLHEEGTSAQQVAGRLETALIDRASDGGKGPVSMLKAVTTALEQANAAYSGEESGNLPTGIPSLDRLIGGLYPGDLVLCGGRPSMGKTGLALCAALNAARAGKGVAIGSLEMTPDALAHRAMAEATSQAGAAVNYSDIRRGAMGEAQFRSVVDAGREVAELPIQILPSSYRDVGSLYAGAKRAKALLGQQCGMHLLVVDYLQLLRAEGRSRVEQIAEISMALKSLGHQLGVPVLALSQLSRALESREDKRPQLSDLRESGQLEQDADVVLFCYRDEYYLERSKPEDDDLEAMAEWQHAMSRAHNRMEIICAKQRQGATGTVSVRFNPATNMIWEDR